MGLAVFRVVARGFIVHPPEQRLAFQLDMGEPFSAGRWTAGGAWFQHRGSLAAHVVRLFSVNGEGGSGSGEAAETAIGKPYLRECGVGDVRCRPARDERNADPDADRSAQVGTLLLAGGRNGLAAALRKR